MNFSRVLVLASAAALAAAPAFAQKAKDTIRIAVNDPFPTVLQYHHPADEATNFQKRIYEELIYLDEYNHKYIPMLAKSWTRVNPTTIEFDLKDDVTFHNGDKFSAEDVKRTIDYVSDPKIPLQFKVRWTWIKSAEILSPTKIRIESFQPNVQDLMTYAMSIPIMDAKVFDKLENKADYGKTAVATGPYKVIQFDTTKGAITVERFADFKGDKKLFPAPVRYIQGVPIPDKQTQIAQLLTGGVDLLRSVSPDVAREFKDKPGFGVSYVATGYFIYVALDAAGRTKNKALQDARVRKAIWQAVDRDTIVKHIVPGGEVGASYPMDTICFDFNVACKVTVKPPKYDPAAAKKLLADAGYAGGFDMEYECFLPIKDVCEAIAGDLRKVGIRASVIPAPLQTLRKHQADGELQASSVFYPTSVFPDTGALLSVFFDGSERDYVKDKKIQEWMTEGLKEFDQDKRTAIYTQALNWNNEQNYVMAFSSMGTAYAHSKDVQVLKDPVVAGDVYINGYAFK